MIVRESTLENYQLLYPLEKLVPLEETLFIDIETTGFSAQTSKLYMLGCVYYSEEKWHTFQWFAENYNEESNILNGFFEFALNYKYLIHFNGNHFDLPYIEQKCAHYELPYYFNGFEGIDIYKRIAPYKMFLRLPNCKQRTIEEFLGIERNDPYTGGDLIDIYHNYVKEPSTEALEALLLHNKEDLEGLLAILPILNYYDFLSEDVTVKKVKVETYRDIIGETRKEMIMRLALPYSLPREISVTNNYCYFRASGEEALLRVPIYEEELKYFYSNYKDYYYLPEEDVALHKSVAGFVDKEYRVPATAATCYTRKFSSYLPQWDIIVQPFFMREYKDKECFFELTDEIKKDRELFNRYANHILNMIFSKK